MSLRYGFQRLVLLGSAGYQRAELPLDDSVSLIAPNNTGKTALINALQYLLIIDKRRMDFGAHSADKSRRFYFPNNSAFIQSSAPERAILEVLSQVDETPTSFTFAAELFEGLTSLRPSVIDTLLQSCLHNEAKRLFLFFATRYDYPWLKRVDVDAVDLGRGKRLVTRGGKLDKRYQITVPEAFYAG